MVREIRKGNIFLMIEDKGDDRYFWQYQEGVRKRQPFASGIADSATIEIMIAKFAGREG